MLERVWKSYLRRRGFSLWYLIVPFLWVASLVYRLGLALDRATKRHRTSVKVPVISVGNISVGGTGKTPIVEYLSGELLGRGVRVGIASSGYGRGSRESLIGDAATISHLDTRTTGDEVKLLAMNLPNARFAIEPLKATAAQSLSESGLVDVIIVDDGFQHHGLMRDIDIVTFDASVNDRSLRLFPLGVLREPLSALMRADAVIVTRSGSREKLVGTTQRLSQISPDLKLYSCRFVSQELIGRSRRFSVNFLKDKKVLLFAGIGNFESLRTQIESLSGDLVYALELADHQRYDSALLGRIKSLADRHQPDILVTTGKDWVKLGGFDFGRECCYLPLTTEIDSDNGSLVTWICEKLHLKTETN